MTNSNLHVMRFLGLYLEDDVPDHSVLSRFRTRLTAARAWDGLLEQVNQQIQAFNAIITKGCHIGASITDSPRKPKTRPPYNHERCHESLNNLTPAGIFYGRDQSILDEREK